MLRHDAKWNVLRLLFLAALSGVVATGILSCRRAPVSDRAAATSGKDTAELPDWLMRAPADWGEPAWKEYQAWLIELREPILRRGDYREEELAHCTARVEHWPGEYEDHVKAEWDAKWSDQLTRYERTGGCGCCNEVYTVTGPRAAIEEFPVHPGRSEYYPDYLQP